MRNGAQAVQLAQQANHLTGGEDPIVLHTLAAAYAEAGRFGEAVATARRASQLASAHSNTALAAALEREIPQYEANIPLRGSP